MKEYFPMLEADLVLEPDDTLFDEKTGNISVTTDIFDDYAGCKKCRDARKVGN